MKYLWMLVMLFPAIAFAEATPQNSPYDSRVRTIDYNPLDVTRINTFYGVSTFVQFAEGETIRDVAVGDEQAWSIVPRGNNLFIKPRARKADTNVTVVTEKRVYHFALMVVPRAMKDATAWRDPNLIYGLSFRYPEDEAARREEQARLEKLKEKHELIKAKLKMSTRSGQGGAEEMPEAEGEHSAPSDRRPEVNYDYWVAGSPEISPTAVRDDGRFTYLEFTNNRDMPAIYAVDAEGKEALINTHVEGNTIVVQRVVPRLTLRKGKAVACLRNSAFNWDGGRDNTLGTTAPDVERTVKEPQ